MVLSLCTGIILDLFYISGYQDDLIEFYNITFKGFDIDLSHIVIILMEFSSWTWALYISKAVIISKISSTLKVSPAFFWKLEKSALIWGKNAQIVVIYGYNFSIKMKFLRVSRGKTRRFFSAGPFFLVL